MNKEIEEMAKVIKDNAWKDIKEVEAVVCATELYEQGYRQCKDKVVLTREEHKIINHNIEHLESVCNDLEIRLEHARKETAEKILNELYCTPKEKVENKIKELARFIGVEIKE
jgi:hypothetical protein